MVHTVHISDDLSQQFRAVAFLCALLVVPIHCWSLSAWAAGVSELTSAQAGVLIFLTAAISRMAVPCFFVISGFFLALGFSEERTWYPKTLLKRFKSIYIPFLIWNLLNLVLLIALGRTMGWPRGKYILSVIGLDPYTSPACMQFWYLQTIIFWVLLSPLVLRILKHTWLAPIVLFSLAFGWITGYHYSPYCISPWAFLWLSVGTFVAFNANRIACVMVTLRTNWGRTILLVCLFASLFLRVYTGVVSSRHLYSHAEHLVIVFGLLNLAVNADQIARALNPIRSLWGLGFFIYAFHTIVISALIIILDKLHVAEFPMTLIKVFGGISISVIVGVAFRRLLPRLFAIVTGGRG